MSQKSEINNILDSRHWMLNNNSSLVFTSLDWFTIALYVILLVWGWFSVCGACYDYNNPDLFSWSTNSGKQLVWILTSFVLAFICLLIEKHFYYNISYPLYVFMILLLLLTIFIAPETKGSRSWIPIGSVKLQPAEFSKFIVALTLAKYMDRFGSGIEKREDFKFAIGMIVLPILLILFQKETGSALVYVAFFLVLYREGMTGVVLFALFAFVIYFIVGIKFGTQLMYPAPVSEGELWVLLLSLVFTVGLVQVFCHDTNVVRRIVLYGGLTDLFAFLFAMFVLPFNVCIVFLIVNILTILYLVYISVASRLQSYWLITLFMIVSTAMFYMSNHIFEHVLQDHQRVRIAVLLGIKDDPRGAGYNVNQAKIAIGSGGFSGKGFLKGTQTKLKYVPEQDTDFIFCTVGEESGFIGSVGVLLVYLILIIRLIILSERQPDTHGRVYGYCVACILLFHLFVNVGMVLGMTPVIGIPLPFFSYGGSSLWGFTTLLFIFLRMDAERKMKIND